MADQFEDIRIVDLDDKATRPSGEGALMTMVLRLSQSAPSAWVELFNHQWSQDFYMNKRRTMASGNRIEINCMPYELAEDHLPQLKKVVAETNTLYRQHLAHLQRQAEERAEAQRRQREEIADVKRRLKFDD